MKKDLWENTQLVNSSFPVNVFHTPFEEHHFLPLHWHEHFEIIRIEQGRAQIHIGGKQLDGSPGELFFVNSGELHAVYQPRDSFLMNVLVFHPSMVGLHSTDAEPLSLVSPYIAGKKTIATLLQPGDDHYTEINRALDLLIHEFNNKEADYEHAVRALCRLLFTWYSRWLTIEPQPEHHLTAFREKGNRFKELINYIEQHYNKNISLEEAASFVHLSPYHFCKTFKQLTGLTFVKFVNLYRIQEADRLLRTTSLSISEISELVGCGSIQSFSKLYKQLKGYPPSMLRKTDNPSP